MLVMIAHRDMEAAEEMRIKEATEMKLSELLLTSHTLPEVCHFVVLSVTKKVVIF